MLKQDIYYYELEISKDNNINLLLDITLDININPFIIFNIKRNKNDSNNLLYVSTNDYIILKDTIEYKSFYNKIFEINIPRDLVNNLTINRNEVNGDLSEYKEFLYSYIESSYENINKIIGYGKIILNNI